MPREGYGTAVCRYCEAPVTFTREREMIDLRRGEVHACPGRLRDMEARGRDYYRARREQLATGAPQ